MIRTMIGILAIGILLVGCGSEPEPPVTEEKPESAQVEESESEENLPKTNLAAIKIGDYDVQPFYAGELSQGLINARVSGKEVGVVRMWVGSEDASGVMVVKAELEGDHYCGTMEMPDPIPTDARLWIEVESPEGERLKGSVPLAQ